MERWMRSVSTAEHCAAVSQDPLMLTAMSGVVYDALVRFLP
jgi:hypothetical protein